jgi:hypothetical protein
VPVDIDKLSTEEIIQLYPKILKKLKKRGVLRTKNFVGEIGEYLAIIGYNKNPNVPNLKRADVGTVGYDAISLDGKRYQIKSASGGTTGVFHGVDESAEEGEQIFEYAVVVRFDDDYASASILEINWNQFMGIKKWHKTMSAWNVPVNNKLIQMAKEIFVFKF